MQYFWGYLINISTTLWTRYHNQTVSLARPFPDARSTTVCHVYLVPPSPPSPMICERSSTFHLFFISLRCLEGFISHIECSSVSVLFWCSFLITLGLWAFDAYHKGRVPFPSHLSRIVPSLRPLPWSLRPGRVYQIFHKVTVFFSVPFSLEMNHYVLSLCKKTEINRTCFYMKGNRRIFKQNKWVRRQEEWAANDQGWAGH